MSNLPTKSARNVGRGTAGAIEWGGSVLGVAACLLVWYQVLPPLLQTATMALGLGLVALGFGAACFAFADLINEGRADPKSVPVLAVRLVLALGFVGWVLAFLFSGAALPPLASNLTLFVGCFVILILFLASSVMRRQVDQAAHDEAEKSENLSRIRAKASRLESEVVLSGSESAKRLIGQVVDELRYLSPSLASGAWDTEMEILQTLTDLVGTDGKTQDEKLQRLLLLIGNRRKVHD
jgi:hypothetical protein